MEEQRRSPLRALLVFILGIYGIFLIAYLILRVIYSDSLDWLALLHNVAPYFFAVSVIGVLVGLLARAKRLVALHLILLAIGAAWIGLRIVPLATPAPAGTTVSVLTLNAYPENQEIDSAISYITEVDPDIVLLQETNPVQDWSDLAAAYDHAAVEDTLAVYSRFPLDDASIITLVDTDSQRVLVDVGVETIALYNVHLAMPFDETETLLSAMRYDETQRNEQIAQLLALLAEEENEYILGGDFNTSAWSPAYDRIVANMTDAFRAGAGGFGATWPAGPFEEWAVPAWFPRLVRLDYIFHSGDITTLAASVGPQVGSDHLPVVATLDIDS